MVADQFLTGLDSHELCVQVTATGVQRIEDLMQIVRSLEAVEGKEAGHGRSSDIGALPRPAFLKKRDPMPKLPRLLSRYWPSWNQTSNIVGIQTTKQRPPTPGPQRVRSVERETLILLPRTPLRARVLINPRNETEDAHPLQIGVGQEKERGPHSVTCAKGMVILCGSARATTFTSCD